MQTPLATFTDAAIAWAAGGRGEELVAAATAGLVDGLDTPSLRVLAGAPRASADDEAHELADDVFAELGIMVEERLSPPAIVRGAQLIARRYLAAEDRNPRNLVRRLCQMSVLADYPAELNFWIGADDTYVLFDDGVVSDSEERLEKEVLEAARELVEL